jgi:branched-chain amino acid transport system ATP-binding protein
LKEILNVRDVTKRFGGIIALNKVSMDIYEGEILGLMGPNGSGKTTLINVISGIYGADGGRIFYHGRDITKVPPHDRVSMGISRTFQTPRPFMSLNVLDNVKIPILRGSFSGDEEEKAYKLLEYIGLADYANDPISKLNLAMRKKLDLARALATEPRLLMVDEIAAGLSEGEITDLANLLKDINKSGITLMVVEHVIPFLKRICSRIVVLDEGVKIAEGGVDEVIKDPKVISAYIGED